ncbi:MAG: hypothetical protein GX596_00480 [Propionibacterium sp.]|nr:hypothetical protein [Propionibacterium sp.]
MTGCAKYREDLSGFVDEILPERRWGEVAYHLAGCRGCRDEVVEIRDVRSALSTCTPHDLSAPSSLANRLEAIAGDAAEQPLYIRSDGPGKLPTKRDRLRRRLAQSSAAVLVVTLSVAVLAIVLAPDARLIVDPVGDAREQFAMQTTAISVQEAVGAVLLAQGRGAALGAPVDADPYAVPTGTSLPISSAAIDSILDQSYNADATLTGVQRVWVTNNDGGYISSDVLISRVPGEGANLVVLDREGNRFLSSFMPEMPTNEISVPDDWTFFTFPALARVTDRDAVIVEARSEGRAVARWWFDVDTGITLRSERYDTSGTPTIMVGYEQLTIGDAQLPSERTQLVSLTTATSGQTRGWCVGITRCPYEVADLPLVAYASSTARGEESMSLVYSDGVQSLTVSWAAGRLADGERIVAQAAAGLPTVSAWQAGRGVVSIATNATPEMLLEARAELPGESPHDEGIWTRLASGMGRLTGLR